MMSICKQCGSLEWIEKGFATYHYATDELGNEELIDFTLDLNPECYECGSKDTIRFEALKYHYKVTESQINDLLLCETDKERCDLLKKILAVNTL